MDVELARWLVSPDALGALAEAAAQPDPGSLAAATALRRHWTPGQAAAALSQAALRRRAVAKFGDRAANLFLTPDGLEQATRADVARWRADRFVAAGTSAVVELGCGIGADVLAFRDAGLAVTAVEADPATAVLASANLGAEVRCADAVEVAGDLLAGGAAVFIDPARRTAAGRTWRIADFSPPWDFATGLLAGRLGCLKAAPGLPSALIPDGVAATWVSHRGALVETSLWSGPWPAGSRTAVLLPSGCELDAGERGEPAAGAIGSFLHEPDPAVIRSRGVGTLAAMLGARCAHPGIAYLFTDGPVRTPFASSFEVLEVLPYDERSLREWVRRAGIGILEIKVRGLDVDPAVLRRRLKPKGESAATLILTPTVEGARALVTRRVPAPPPTELSESH